MEKQLTKKYQSVSEWQKLPLLFVVTLWVNLIKKTCKNFCKKTLFFNLFSVY